ncbi:MAG: prepilin-type N-terminal cleavage/methylation domain-containing protein [Lentisphaeria bacterium]|nr:prepilin-type N-terminal cleavage/methylation domain-containing protein [Lentisphaeria bacterium]
MKRIKSFTLIEILVVIAIIGILAACIYPALMAVQNNSRRTKTETILTGVNTAIKMYKGDYYGLPMVGGSVQKRIGEWSGNIDFMKPDSTYTTFFDILTYKNHENAEREPSEEVRKANSKAKQYLDPPKEYFRVKDNLHSIRDAWNRPIVVFLDKNEDERVEIESSYANGDTILGGDSVAISLGNQPDSEKKDKDSFIVVK